MKVKKAKRKNKKKQIIKYISALIAIMVFCFSAYNFIDETEINAENNENNIVYNFFENNVRENLLFYPDNLKELYERNEEAKDFVLSYYENKDKDFEINLSKYLNKKEMPLFMQWDKRWGYKEYAGNLMGLSGCGPTCLSMVAFHLTQDEKYTPLFVAQFAEENGYCINGNGTLWTLFTEGAVKLGFNVETVPLWESVVAEHLQNGKPIICNVGKGVFTESGHYIVLTKYENGLIYVNDPNRKSNSKGWPFDEFSDQIKNMWAISI